MTQNNGFLGTIGWIKSNLMISSQASEKGYSNENFYPGAPSIPESEPTEINYDLTAHYNTGNIQPIPSYNPTVIYPTTSYNFFYVYGLPNVVKLNNWELKFCVNGWNFSNQYAIILGKPERGYTNSYYTINQSGIFVENDTYPYSTLIGKLSSDLIPANHTDYYVTLKYEADKGYTFITEASGSPVEYFFNNHIKPQKPELNDFTIRFKDIQFFTRSITFKSW